MQRIPRTRRIGYVAFSGFQFMTMATLPVFEVANLSSESFEYDVQILSERGGPVVSSSGVTLETRAFPRINDFHTIVVGGGTVPEPASPALIRFLRQAADSAQRIASICTGAFVLAEAGLLDGRRATTHWLKASDFKSRFPRVNLAEDRIYVIDGQIWTSAGMTAGIDLALAMVEADLGSDVARSVAKILLVYHRRSGGASQSSSLLELDPKSDQMQSVLTFAKSRLHTALSVEDLARAAHLSPRQFSRAFRAEIGESPAKAIERLRLEAARTMLEEGNHSFEAVAQQTGFVSRERMRRVFIRAFGRSPQAVRRESRRASR